MALGTMARNLVESDPARARAIVNESLGRLRASHSEEQTRLRLMALGNAGSVLALPAIAGYLAHPSPILRATAATALRWIDDPSVDLRLLRCLASDRDPKVRQEAAAALGAREPTATGVAAQQRAFRTERVEGVRLALLSNLGRALGTFPQLRPWIQATAGHDRMASVRKAAGALLTASSRS